MKPAESGQASAFSLSDVPSGMDLAALAARTSYVGSPEHKTYPSLSSLIIQHQIDNQLTYA
jgi:hypothetical protein